MGFTDATMKKYLGPPDELGVGKDNTEKNIRLWHLQRVKQAIRTDPDLPTILRTRKESQDRKAQAGSRTPKAQES